jgi:hypothetical protein
LRLAARHRRCVVWVLLSLISAASLLRPPAARADGDPASDVLLVDNVFLPYSSPVAPSLAALLTKTVRSAHAAGFPIKVALIGTPQDLGAVPRLFGTPQRYAQFLDLEISYNSQAKLLVVMPQGFGTVGVGPPGTLSAVHVDAAQKADGLARAAIEAVAALARRQGYSIPAPALPGAGTGSETTPWPFVAVGAGLIVLVGAGLADRRRRSRKPHGAGTVGGADG